MSDSNKDRIINWPTATAIMVGSVAFVFMVWATTRYDDAKAAAQVENNKNRIEYDKWLLEKGFIKEPRIR